jgi:putative ABC transport system permease protein
VSALDRKLWRELWNLRGQVLAISVVIAGGVSTLLMSLATLDSLTLTRDAFYRDYRFAEVFVSLKRAPESLRETIAAIPGVQQVETRVVAAVNLDIPDFADPATGVLVSLPERDGLNQLHLLAGRRPEPERDDETVVSQAFAAAHGFGPGAHLSAIIDGRLQRLTIVGIAVSPEYIYQIKPGDLFPDFARHGVLWMNREPLARAYDMDGAFNDLLLTLTRAARPKDVIERLDVLLEPYGGPGAIERSDQLSDRYLDAELEQLAGMARLIPGVFLGVAAFLLNVVLGRLIGAQRDQIAILKAFGYSAWQIGGHYVRWALVIILLGLVIGLGAGLWFGLAMAELYRGFFYFPYLEFSLRPQVIAVAVMVTLGAGLAGTLAAVHRAVRLPPAEAMQPEPPPRYRPTLVERFGLQRFLSQPTRMILRHIERRPFKSLLSILGIGLACGILMVGRFQEGALDYLIQVQYGLAQRDDLTVTFSEPTSRRVVLELGARPGVDRAEPTRQVAVRLRHANADQSTAIQGLEPDSRLRRILDDRLRVQRLPAEGLVLSDQLARLLGVGIGDQVEVEILEGRRERHRVVVAGLVREFTGLSAYMDLEALNRLLGEGEAVTGALLAVEPGARDRLVAELKAAPRVAGVTDRLTAIQSFMDSMTEIVLSFAFVSTLLAGSIAFGVVYNDARITLTERARELATLRVLGFSLGEITAILLGELALLTAIAIPVGFGIGWGLIALIVRGVESELYRIPLILEPSVFAFAASVILVAALLSGLLVARRLRRLDLVAVLKTRE